MNANNQYHRQSALPDVREWGSVLLGKHNHPEKILASTLTKHSEQTLLVKA